MSSYIQTSSFAFEHSPQTWHDIERVRGNSQQFAYTHRVGHQTLYPNCLQSEGG